MLWGLLAREIQIIHYINHHKPTNADKSEEAGFWCGLQAGRRQAGHGSVTSGSRVGHGQVTGGSQAGRGQVAGGHIMVACTPKEEPLGQVAGQMFYR